MSTAWERTTKILATIALGALGALTIGCGPAPGYEQQEPRVPVGYTQVSGPEPATSEELAARAQAAQAARAQAGQPGQGAPEGYDPQAAATPPNGDVVVGADNNQYADTDPSALTEFKQPLDGHGRWVDDSTYGTVWVPSEAEVGTDFVPYTTAGHWTYADDTSWVWVSDYSWGWAPFHYGRWAHVGHHGWVWIPGRTYSGAWVSWRTGPGYDYVGWAPLGPDWYWYNGYAAGWTFGYSPYYSYCDHRYIYDRHLGPYVVRGPAAAVHEGHTRPYVAAAPTVGGGGRTAASPTVGGAGVGGRTAASPSVGAMAHAGPRPGELGIKSENVVAPPTDHAGLNRAHALSNPSTAVAAGAAPPAQVTRRRVDQTAIASQPSARGAGGGFDGRSSPSPGASRFDAAARSPQVAGVAPSGPRPSSSFTDSGARSQPSRGAFSGSSGAQPSSSFHSQPSVAASQPFHSGATAPAYHSPPSFSSSPSTVHSTPSAPTVSHSSPAPAARPATRSAAPRGRR